MSQKTSKPAETWPAFRNFFARELEARGIVPFQLATNTGIPYSTILTALSPKASNIKLDTIVRIMDSLKLSWADVVKGIECKPPKPKTAKRNA